MQLLTVQFDPVQLELGPGLLQSAPVQFVLAQLGPEQFFVFVQFGPVQPVGGQLGPTQGVGLGTGVGLQSAPTQGF